MNRITTFTTASLATLVLLGGCQVHDAADICRSDCRLTVTLPEDIKRPPAASQERLELAGGVELEIRLVGGTANNRATVLRFDRPGQSEQAGTPFVDRNGRPVYRVVLNAGSRRLRTRPWEDQACRPPEGCKYDIVNTGNPDRPAKDPWIILHR